MSVQWKYRCPILISEGYRRNIGSRGLCLEVPPITRFFYFYYSPVAQPAEHHDKTWWLWVQIPPGGLFVIFTLTLDLIMHKISGILAVSLVVIIILVSLLFILLGIPFYILTSVDNSIEKGTFLITWAICVHAIISRQNNN